jgi:hypothetical protein
MKPDVLKQMKELGEKRKKMEKKMMEERERNMIFLDANSGANAGANSGAKGTGGGSTIVLQEEGKPPRELNHHQVVEMMTSQQKQLAQMGQLKELYGNSMRENVRLKEIIETQQKILDDKNVYISELETKIAESREVIVVDVGK